MNCQLPLVNARLRWGNHSGLVLPRGSARRIYFPYSPLPTRDFPFAFRDFFR
jgi:hypothetical protein